MRWSVVPVCAVLFACGGGGGARDNGWLTFDPPRIEASTYEGDPASLTVVATSTRQLAGPIQVGVIDQAGVLDGTPSMTYQGTRVTGLLRMNPALPAGVHDGSLEIRLCQDSPVTCAQPWGGPWQLPYRIIVLPGTNLTPLAALPGAGPWRTVGGDSGHTGFVPASVDPARFSRRWSIPAFDRSMNPLAMGLVVEGGRVYYLRGGTSDDWTVTAYSEADGQPAWTHDVGTFIWVGQPAAGQGHVYVAASDISDKSALWVLDQATGALVNRLRMDSQFDRWGSPEVYGDAIYLPNGHSGGLSRLDGLKLSGTWFSSDAPWSSEPYTVLADGASVFTCSGGDLVALNESDGKAAFRIPIASSAGGAVPGVPGLAPVLGPGGSVVHVFFGAESRAGLLERFDVVQQTNPWEKAGSYNSEPAVADGIVYIVNGQLLEALDASTGDRRWSWDIPGAPPGLDPLSGKVLRQQVLVIGRHAFVTSASALHAVDVDTHQAVWTHPVTGRLVASENGILYVLARNGRLVAINLH